MGYINVTSRSRVGKASKKEIEMNNKILQTIQTIPKIQTKSDLKLLFDNIDKLPKFEAICMNLSVIGALEPVIHTGHVQMTLEGTTKTDIRHMLDDRIIFIDPETEWYRKKFILSKERKDGKDILHTKQSQIFDQDGFPPAIRRIFEKHGTEGHNLAWNELRRENLLLSFVVWHLERTLKYGGDIIIPPTPIIDGKNVKMLEIATAINNISKEITFDHASEFSAIYYPIHSDAFEDDQRCIRILKTIRNSIKQNSLLIIKFFMSRNILNNSANRARMGRFLSTLDMFKMSVNDSLAIMVLDTRDEGVAMFGNGVDLTTDPMGGVKDEMHFNRKKKMDDVDNDEMADVEEDEINLLKRHGRYIHPDTRQYEKISNLIPMLNGNLLPHDCYACNTLHGRLADPKSSEFPKSKEWNESRRIHNFIFRKEEDSMIDVAIEDENSQALRIYLGDLKRGNKHLIDLLSHTSY